MGLVGKGRIATKLIIINEIGWKKGEISMLPLVHKQQIVMNQYGKHPPIRRSLKHNIYIITNSYNI